MNESYRTSHVAPGYGRMYAEIHQRPFKALTLSLETRILDEVIRAHVGKVGKYLDFACGTGRICGLVAPRAGKAFGVDISPDMLEVARERLTNVEILQGDISDASTDAHRRLAQEGPFDLITSFRFFLNAEHALRATMLRTLHPLLADDGWFIFNIHKNRTSLRWGADWVKEKLKGKPSESVSYAYMSGLLRENGFKVHRVRSYFFPPYAASLKMPQAYWNLDLKLGKLPLLRQLGHFQIYLCRKA